MTGHDQRAYLALSNGVVRAMRQLGLKPAPERGPSLAEGYRAYHRGARRGGGMSAPALSIPGSVWGTPPKAPLVSAADG
jgi:hypothetical protein